MIESSFDENRMFRRLADDLLDADEFAALERRLLEDPECRRRYLKFADFEACLHEETGRRLLANVAPALVNNSGFLAALGIKHWALAAALVVAGLAIGFWAFGKADDTRITATRFAQSDLRGLKEVAVVTHREGVPAGLQETALVAGTRLKPGVLTVAQGKVQLQFLGGARVVLVAPAELHLLSAEAATLVKGTATARIGAGAKQFVLNAPDAAIVDLGTEFAVNVDDAGNSEVHVNEGEVEVSLLGRDGNTLVSQLVSERSTVRIDPRAGVVQAVDSPRTNYPSILEVDRRGMVVNEDYVREVRSSLPKIYWRFETAADGLVPNEMGPALAARILAPLDEPQALTIVDGVARFDKSTKPRYLISEGFLSGINTESYSLELWVKPETFHWGSLVNLMPPAEVSGRHHLSLLELVYQTSMVHDPGVLRFLHRFPPRGQGGVNIFANEILAPGRWHHVVAVKRPTGLRLFVDGVLAQEQVGEMGCDLSSYRLSLGQLGSENSRKFEGQLDEFAVYDRALEDAEIRRHFNALAAHEVLP